MLYDLLMPAVFKSQKDIKVAQEKPRGCHTFCSRYENKANSWERNGSWRCWGTHACCLSQRLPLKVCQKAGNALWASPRAWRRARHHTLHSPSMVASTAPPGQNSIMIWGNKERGIKSQVRVSLSQAHRLGKRRRKRWVLLPRMTKLPLSPHRDAEASVLPRTHPPGIPSIIAQTLRPDPAYSPQHPSQRDRPHRCDAPSSRAWPHTWTPTPSFSQLQLRAPLFTSLPIAFWSESCSRERPCQEDEIAVIAGS